MTLNTIPNVTTEEPLTIDPKKLTDFRIHLASIGGYKILGDVASGMDVCYRANGEDQVVAHVANTGTVKIYEHSGKDWGKIFLSVLRTYLGVKVEGIECGY